ncbi:MAG: VacJ family lipoprotein [Azonexus sp.]|nr:VacJ family lipoprotein [Azonexus sp.]
MRKFYRLLAAGVVGLAFSGVVMAEGNPRDPYEGFNRAMYSVNEAVDKFAAKPVAQVYDKAFPLPVKAGVGNFFGNVGDLWIGVNGALQGKFGDAGIDLGRLLVNSTVGIFGLFDVASELGLEKHDEDSGQTLAVWGVGDGAYLFWPIIGPRTMRDTAGWMIDSYVDPVWRVRPISVRNSLVALRFVDIRASLLPADKVVEEAALDKYAYVRDAYLQRRRNQIFDGRPPRLDD